MDPSKETCKLVTVPLLLSVLLLRHNHPSAARCCIFGLLDGFLRGLAKGTTDAWRMVQRWERQLLDSSDYWPNTVTEFFLDLSAATSSCTRRELSSCPLKQAFSCTPRVPIRWKMQQLLDTEEFQWLWLFQSLSCVCFRQRSVHFSHLYHICFWNWATYRFKVGHHDSCTVSICYISSGKQLHKSLWGQPAFRCAGPPRLDRRTWHGGWHPI